MSLNMFTPSNAENVVPNDNLSQWGVAIMAGTAGNISLLTEGNSVVTIPVVAGIPVPIRFQRVRATNTTATNIVRFFA